MYRHYYLLAACLALCTANGTAQPNATHAVCRNPLKATPIALEVRLRNLLHTNPDGRFSITLCADIPCDHHSNRIFHHRNNGHVFLIASALQDSSNTVPPVVFGFYPHRPLLALLIKQTRGKVMDNAGRQYEASITSIVCGQTFNTWITAAVQLAHKKYHLNRFNCYDYAIQLFNILQQAPDLPAIQLRFPLWRGFGGTPCALYLQLAGKHWNLKNHEVPFSAKLFASPPQLQTSTPQNVISADPPVPGFSF